ncbi:hypothetical protein FIA58_005970 [Flavobacterium jejuense]|uniref:Sugar transporter n=1 Tax=Flavobacterium jejuense TaxID=1544455 RepID=A0ABX0INQ2_9FLAO|nr:hypothetical protein [Flavobacterium jejuense]NHN25221.1 hypothetical protein [Flavobacterium jejuense]
MTKPKTSFWIISVVALLWNLMGVNQYLLMAFKSDSVRSGLTPERLALLDATPSWSTAAFAIAVFAATIGCIALLIRKKIAYSFFVISFLGIIVQNIDAFMRFKIREFNSFELVMTIMIPVIGLFLIWYSKNAIKKEWLK